MAMTRVLLDGNIYDKLKADETTRRLIYEKIVAGILVVIASPIVVDELNESPFNGLPDFFPVKQITEAIAVAGYARAGLARVSNGEVYDAHRGTSKKSKDAIIAETANVDCDVFVSEDQRCRKRLKEVEPKCLVLSYDEYKEWLN